MSAVNHATHTLSLGDTEYTLKPTLEAYNKIQQRFGGLRGALEGLAALNLDHLAAIAAAGAGIKSKAEIEALKEAIFDHGIADVTEQVSAFVAALFNPRGDKGDDAGN